MSRQFTASQKHAVMTKLLGSAAGRAKIASSLNEPLRTLQDYQSVARRAFLQDELPDGTLPIYDRDPDVPAFVVGEEADSIQTVVNGKRLLVPLFELASNPTIPFTQVKERRFDVVKRVKEKAKVEIFRREDRTLFALMKRASSANQSNVVMNINRADFNIAVLADAFAKIERKGWPVDKVFMNPAQFPVIRKAGRDYIDFETQRQIIQTGLLGVLWGAQIHQSMEVPEGSIFLTTTPEGFGVMPQRIPLTVIPADVPATRQFGWSVFQQTGAAIHNPENGLQEVRLV